ncbi:MAG: hypothetical protein CMK89_11565 [Pseudomonadales bacterium]|nr:hypothetical protein [Pseudomonadales bacterium]
MTATLRGTLPKGSLTEQSGYPLDHSLIQSFNEHRQSLLGLAYRIVGSVSDAEDILQEAFIRWSQNAREVEKPFAWLSTVVTRLALDHCKTAEEKRKQYFGPWLPEPLVSDQEDPEQQHQLDQSLTMALLVVLDRLSPSERAAFILHDLFDFNFDDIAGMLDKSAAACRQLASRSRAKLSSTPVASTISGERHVAMAEAFFHAIRAGDTEALVNLLSEDVIFHSDGGGKAAAARQILEGRDTVVQWILRAISPNLDKAAQALSHQLRWFNGAPGLLLFVEGNPVTAFHFVISTEGIQAIYALRNPDKLRFFKDSDNTER